jgi:hypothetical protein
MHHGHLSCMKVERNYIYIVLSQHFNFHRPRDGYLAVLNTDRCNSSNRQNRQAFYRSGTISLTYGVYHVLSTTTGHLLSGEQQRAL